MQSLWLAEMSWDEPVPRHIYDSWIRFSDSLAKLNSLKIPQWLSTSEVVDVELHGFADASEAAYGASIYDPRIN